jgi:hypothetical protein
MGNEDTSERVGSGVTSAADTAGGGCAPLSTVTPYLRQAVASGAVPAALGVIGLLSGFRAVRGGTRARGVAKLLLGAGLVGVGVAQFRSRSAGAEAADGEVEVGVHSSVETTTDAAPSHGADRTPATASATQHTDVANPTGAATASDVETPPADEHEVAESGGESADRGEGAARETGPAPAAFDSEAVDRLGEAAFDGQSREVPAPQRAFNQGLLAHSTEAFWGVRARDGVVLVSQDYDAVQGRDGVDYVASSEVGDDVRELSIPTTVLDHWDEVYGGGSAVVGGDDILFVTTTDLADDGLLCVLPADWAEDVLVDSA